MTKIIFYESENTPIVEAKRSPKGKKEKVIKYKDWKGDEKKMKELAEKEKE